MIQLKNVSKVYRSNNQDLYALNQVNINVEEGKFVVFRGPSGSGKTTLLLTIGGLLKPTKGEVIVSGKEVYKIKEQQRSRFRAENIGFIFQLFHLIPYLNVFENVLMASSLERNGERFDKATKLLTLLGIIDRKYHKPSELSVGERQRTAVARALLSNPRIILADEPTGNLDSENADEVLRYLSEFNKGGGTVIVVTHTKTADQYADRVIYLKDGRIY